MSDDAIRLTLPTTRAAVAELRAGQAVLLSGTVYTARDAAHKRIQEAVREGSGPPVSLEGQAIYYCGPAPAPEGAAVGSCGPTSSARMDPYLELTLSLGVVATIGKGNRSAAARQALRDHGAVYLIATGGAGALLAQRVLRARVAAYEDLGAEALHELTLADFPVLVGYDAEGGTIFAGEEPLVAGVGDEDS